LLSRNKSRKRRFLTFKVVVNLFANFEKNLKRRSMMVKPIGDFNHLMGVSKKKKGITSLLNLE